MSAYSLAHLSDASLKHELHAAMSRERRSLAIVLAHIGEFDVRRLYLPEGYSSMYAYCLGALWLSEQSAYKRILVARAARQFPTLLTAIADGQLHLSAAVMLSSHLAPDTAEELITAAAHKTKVEIEGLLAQRFPRPDLPTELKALPESAVLATTPPEASPLIAAGSSVTEPSMAASAPGAELSPGIVPPAATPEVPQSKVTPLAPQRFGLQITIDEETHAMLRYAQELLSHEPRSNDLPNVLKRALQFAIPKLEKRKFAATSSPRRPGRRSRQDSRHIPAEVKRAVWKRDGGRCTYVSATGHRCEERRRIEFDHVHEFARGGQSTISGLRLRCRAHNQYGAECTYGAEFMRNKRREAGQRPTAAPVVSRTEGFGASSGSMMPVSSQA